MSPAFDAASHALALRDAETGDAFVPYFTQTVADMDWRRARSIARARDALRRADGEELIGFKLGWTSEAMREALGIDRPNWGTVWDVHRLGGAVDRQRFRHPKIEPEFVYLAGSRLGADATVSHVLDQAEGWTVGLEVVDPRFAGYDFDWLDNTADNSSIGGIAIGDVVTAPDDDPSGWSLQFDDGQEERIGSGEVVMGSPAEAVVWLARQLAQEGAAIEPGMIVFTGGVAAPFDVMGGCRYRARCDQLGVDVSLSAQ